MLSPFFISQAQSLFMKRSSVFQSVFVLRKPLSKKQERSFTRSATSLDMEKFSLASKYKGIFIFDVQTSKAIDTRYKLYVMISFTNAGLCTAARGPLPKYHYTLYVLEATFIRNWPVGMLEKYLMCLNFIARHNV